MELSSDVQRGLQAAGSGVLTEQVFEKLVREAVQDSIGPGDASDLTSERLKFASDLNVYLYLCCIYLPHPSVNVKLSPR